MEDKVIIEGVMYYKGHEITELYEIENAVRWEILCDPLWTSESKDVFRITIERIK